MLYYIGERTNPQLTKPYFKSYGRLTKKKANEMEKTLYGSMDLEGFKDKKTYEEKIEKLKTAGFSITPAF